MKSQMLKVMGLMAIFAGVAVSASAQATSTAITFGASATLPKATGFTCKMSNGFTTGTGSTAVTTFKAYTGAINGTSISLPFGNLIEAVDPATGTGYGWYKSQVADFFVCDLQATGGLGSPSSVKFTYAEGDNPNSVLSRPGLGSKGTMSAAAVQLAGTSTTETSLGSQLFKNVGAISITGSQLPAGKWARFYFGLNFVPAGGTITDQVFSASDATGTYTGTITATVTL